MNIKLGLSSYTYTWSVGVPGSLPANPLSAGALIDKAFSAGIRLVQFADNMPLENMSDGELDHLRNYSAGRDVSIEMGSRGLTPDHTFRCLETARKLHSPILRMVTDQPGYEPGIESINRVISDLLPELKSRKIKLAIENHDRFSAREFEEIILSSGHEWVGICLDSVNSMGAGEGFEKVSEILIPYTINLHIKDFRIFRVSHKMGFVIEGMPAGQGMLDIKKLVHSLAAFNRCHSAILELWTPPAADIEKTISREEKWAHESIEYLKEIFYPEKIWKN